MSEQRPERFCSGAATPLCASPLSSSAARHGWMLSRALPHLSRSLDHLGCYCGNSFTREVRTLWAPRGTKVQFSVTPAGDGGVASTLLQMLLAANGSLHQHSSRRKASVDGVRYGTGEGDLDILGKTVQSTFKRQSSGSFARVLHGEAKANRNSNGVRRACRDAGMELRDACRQVVSDEMVTGVTAEGVLPVHNQVVEALRVAKSLTVAALKEELTTADSSTTTLRQLYDRIDYTSHRACPWRRRMPLTPAHSRSELVPAAGARCRMLVRSCARRSR
jgi:hypothetical protein